MFDKKNIYFFGFVIIFIIIILLFINKENMNEKDNYENDKLYCNSIHGNLFCPKDPMRDSEGPCTCLI